MIDKKAKIDWLKSIYYQSIIPIEIFNPEGVLVDCNKACLDFFGIDSVNDVAGFNLFDDPNLTSQQKEKIRKGVKVRFEIKFNFDLVHKLKLYKTNKYGISYLDCSVTSVTRGNNEIQGYLLYLSDITKKIEAEQALKERESQLEQLNDAKDKFFSIIAHDLRSPFNTILGFSDLLSNNAKTYDTERIVKFSADINSAAVNTLALLDNLLNWAKSQTGQITFKPVKLNLQPIIVQTIKDLNPMAKFKNISLNYTQSEDIEVYADLNMFKTILRNLISNAIKFTNSRGTIEVNAMRKDNFIEIAVSDNGVGMSEETLNKLFTIHANEKTLGTANEKGSGLGLILCKEFVEKHDGKIWAESEIGKGSYFKFTLPLNS